MKGYKGMNKNMTCRDMQYKIGGTYHVDGQIKVCVNGLHFCRNLKDVFAYYPIGEGNRFFAVETYGAIDTDGKKSAAETMIVTRELERKEICRCFYGDGYGNGDGNGDGYGYGYGYGNGNGYCNCNGNGNGNGNGYCNGNGNGNGNGYGYGNGDGDGYGDGYGYGIQKILLFND